jgi:hypothetical protein
VQLDQAKIESDDGQSLNPGAGIVSRLRAVRLTDRLGMMVLAIVTTVAAAQLFWGGTIIGQDSATQFYPWYDYLGERLAGGDIPGWNPYQFAGVSFAADPQSGWMYFPAMIIFTLLPLATAVPIFIVFHLILAGAGTYTLSRLLGMGAGGALVAGVAYQLAPPIYGRSVCCPAQYEVGSWMPIALVGAELAMRTQSPTGRVGGWIIAGVAVSQALGAWLGQGGYYFLLFLTAYIAYRGLIAPNSRETSWFHRLRKTAMHGFAVMGIGFGLAAAGILPRLEYISRSNVAGGDYGEENKWATDIGGVTPLMIFDRLIDPTLYYPGVIVLVLAAAAIPLAKGRYATSFFILWGIGAVVMALPVDTPLHLLLYTVLPMFEQLHSHWPDRVAIVSYLSFAVGAGAGAEALISRTIPARRKLIAVAIPISALLLLVLFSSGIPQLPVILLVLVTGLFATLLLRHREWVQPALPAALALLVAIDLLVAFNGSLPLAPYGGFHRVEFDQHFDEAGAANFLQERMKDYPGRYIGFDPEQEAIVDGQLILYRYQFATPEMRALLVNNRGVLHGIEDAQGYNPVQPARFVDYLTAMNGHPQEYHDANVYGPGLDSPLLDLLAIRYIVIPAEYLEERIDLRDVDEAFPTIYADERVKVLENPDAVPNAWIVNQAQQVASEDMLDALASGEIDPSETALLESMPPNLTASSEPSSRSVQIVERSPEHIRLDAASDQPGLVVLSETWDPNWRAYVNGEQVEIYRANYLFRAVPIPAGESSVELRYEPPALRLGLAVTAFTAGAALIALAWTLRHRIRQMLLNNR